MKAEPGRRIAGWLASGTRPTVAGIDHNGPTYEHADGSVQLWPHDAPELLGPTRPTGAVTRWSCCTTVNPIGGSGQVFSRRAGGSRSPASPGVPRFLRTAPRHPSVDARRDRQA